MEDCKDLLLPKQILQELFHVLKCVLGFLLPNMSNMNILISSGSCEIKQITLQFCHIKRTKIVSNHWNFCKTRQKPKEKVMIKTTIV